MKLSLGYQVLAAVVLGIFCGIFLGPLCNVFRPVGNIYVMLLQMVALPYICFSLIHGLGSITPESIKKLIARGWIFWISIWLVTFFIIYFSSLLIPKAGISIIGDAVDQSSLLAKNFLTYLVPENPFYDLANNIVPAIAVFGLIIGIALMYLEKKEPVISLLEKANQIIETIFKWLAILSPIGIFAHIAVAMGSVHFEDLYAIEFYVVCFILICLFIVFWILPIFIISLTDMKYKDILSAYKIVCLLPFATALPTLSLPFINYYMKKIPERRGVQDSNFHSTSQTVMPLCFSFGQIGNCLILFYILFLSFYYRHPFVGSEKGLLTILTVPMSIGSSATSINAVSFLIQSLNFPEEAIDLFTETLAITLNFQVLLSTASMLTLIILVLYSYYDLLVIRWRILFLNLILAFVIFGIVLIGAKHFVHLRDNYTNLYMDLKINEIISQPVHAKMLVAGEGGAPRNLIANPEAIPLAEILKTGILKVGYDTENIPYCYWNSKQQLVGYDIAYAYQLARDLDCTIEFYPIALDRLGEDLNEGKYDIGMAAIIMNEERIRNMFFTHPYKEEDNVLLVQRKNITMFNSLQTVLSNPNLKLGGVGGYQQVISRHFPLATLVPESQAADPAVELNSGRIDGWMWSKFPSLIWCLSHPDFVVAEYGGLIGKKYFAYPIRSGSIDWASFLNNWLILKEQSGFKAQMERYWFHGESPKERPPRWSVVRNLLHWLD